MKVVQINGNAYRGSTGKIVRQLHDMLRAKGDECTIVCSGNKEKSKDEDTVIVSNKFEIKLHQILGILLGNSGFHSKRVTKKIIKRINSEKPDIVHLHHIEGYFVDVKLLIEYLKKAKIKTVWTIHDCWPFTGHCTHFTIAGCEKWKSGCFKCPQLNSYPYSAFFDQSKKLYNFKKDLLQDWKQLNIVNVSKWMMETTEASFLKRCKKQLIYNGIDIDVFVPLTQKEMLFDIRKKHNLVNKFIILGVASSWNNKKGLEYFKILSEQLSSKYAIVLVGLSHDQINLMPKGLIGVERTHSKEELREYYSQADVFMNLSMEETMGLVTVEAMSCGTPVIVCNSTASPELVNDDCGVIINDVDTKSVIDALNIIESKNKSIYSVKCRKFVEENFSDSKMCKEYYKLYSSLIGD